MAQEEFKKIGQIIPVSGSQEESIPLSDILTEAEKNTVIENAIREEKIAKTRKMVAYAGQDFIDARLKETDWMSVINVEEILKSANQRKHWAVEKENDRVAALTKERQERKELEEKWDANYFFNIIKQYFIRFNRTPEKEGKFFFDKTNELLIKSVCYKFSKDQRYETELGFDFKKGLMINGDAGFGKTKTFEAIKTNPIKPISIYSMLDISEEVKEKGSCELNLNNCILLDDVGSEQEIVNHFGTKINWFKNFIEKYYHHKSDFSDLIVTSNKDGQGFEESYGYRVRSRSREMFDNITVKGPDKRGMFK